MQQFGVDYTDTFAPAVHAASLQILLSFGAQKGTIIVQVNAKNAYLNTRLQGRVEIYMKLPLLYKSYQNLPPELEKECEVVCKLLALMYGTKQGTHNWYANVKQILLTLGYSVSITDEAVFYKLDSKKYTIVAATTDDFTIIANSTKSSDLIKNQLNEHFKIVDLGDINWLLGVNIKCDLKNKQFHWVNRPELYTPPPVPGRILPSPSET